MEGNEIGVLIGVAAGAVVWGLGIGWNWYWKRKWMITGKGRRKEDPK